MAIHWWLLIGSQGPEGWTFSSDSTLRVRLNCALHENARTWCFEMTMEAEPLDRYTGALASVTQSWSRQHLHSQFICEHCGKQYTVIHHLENHQRTLCNSSKRKLAELLSTTKEFWEDRKKRRLEEKGGDNAPHPGQATANDSNSFLLGSLTVVLFLKYGARGSHLPSNPARNFSRPLSEPEGSVLPQDLDTPVAQRKGKRETRLPARFRQEDTLPEVPAIEIQVAFEKYIPPLTKSGCAQLFAVRPSKRNVFGVLRAYRLPQGSNLTHDPYRTTTLMDLTDSKPTKPTPTKPTKKVAGGQESSSPAKPQWGPFSSKSAFSLADWYWHSGNKSFADFQKLITIFRQPDFSLADTIDVDWRAAFKALGANREDLPDYEGEWIRDDGWKTTPITIDIPFHRLMRNRGTESYNAGNFHHRSIVSVIREKIGNAKDSASFHYQPYQASWKPNDSDEATEVELYGELYASRAFREAHDKVQGLPLTERNDGLERVVVGLMIWSDGTQLTSFGGASLWPCYMFFGNESKYTRCQPSKRLGEQIAYFMKLPDSFDDYVRERNKAKLGAPTDTERREERRSEAKQRELVDAARNEIQAEFAVDGTRVDAYLKKQSLVPVHNAFSARLSQVSFEIIPALAIDLLHEFEIGVWKRLFIHLIRLLHAFKKANSKGSTLTAVLDSRQVPAWHSGSCSR
ncbi:hypothetical protein FA13DRAFT_1711682 [Coprinellus micaceus]|uniref:C2H2-type domain-containing protein n=1 Tax=Coprinellus micaceus TaxID=71717 RepID=A0A4Y7T3C5_COPMI|nr:hypothetical protein FA13DRAFT_1711682 [Coprinellus micaceus]